MTTHYGLATPVSDTFLALLAAAEGGMAPPGVDPALLAVVDLMTLDFEDAGLRTPLEHFDAVIDTLGLRLAA